MSEFSIRGIQLKKIKSKFLLKTLTLLFMVSLLDIILFILYFAGYRLYLSKKNNLYILYGNIILVIIYSIFFLIILFLILFFIYKHYKKANKKFHQLYLDYLFEECKLNDVYYKFRKKTLDKSLYVDLEDDYPLNKMNIVFSLIDASPERVLDYLQINYIKDYKRQNAVLLNIKTQSFINGFLQIRTRGTPIKKTYENKDIIRFGFSRKDGLAQFSVFSSFGSSTYKLENSEFSTSIAKLSNFLKTDFVITYSNSQLSIFIDDFEFNFTSSLLSYHEDNFDRKVNALLRLHKLINEVITLLLSLHI